MDIFFKSNNTWLGKKGDSDLFFLLKLINQNIPDFSLKFIPEDDAETFAMLSKAETEDVPLLNENWIRKCLSIVKPCNLCELNALMSLYHNGPTELLPIYMDAKRGMLPQNYQILREIEPLKKTYGIIVYKKQMIDVFTQVARFSEADALDFCRVLFQKDRNLIDRYERKLNDSMAQFHMNPRIAEIIKDMTRAFSNESYKRKIGFWHTVLTYRMVYIKCHYSGVFWQK